jgi:hypothetical protein
VRSDPAAALERDAPLPPAREAGFLFSPYNPAMRRAVYVLFCAAVVAALATYAWRGWYARYITDDFCTAGYLRSLGFLGAMKFHRNHWSGRFSYFPVKAALELVGNVTTRFTPVALMLLLGGAVAHAARRLTGVRSLLLLVMVAVTAVFALVDASPSMSNIAGSWFWETGAITYILPLVVFTFWFGLLGWRRSLPMTCAASAALMFFAGGLSETSLAAQGAVTGLLLLFSLWYRRRREAWIAGAGLVATLGALAIVGSAAGNAARGMVQTQPRPPLETLLLTLHYANAFLGWHVFPSAAAFLPLIAVGVVVGMNGERISGKGAAVVAVTAIGAYVVSYLPSAWLLPWTVPERALDVPNYFLAVALFAAAVGGGWRMRQRLPEPAVMAALALLTIVPVLSIAENVEELPRARSFAAHFDEMDRYLQTQKGEDAVLKHGQWALGPGILGPKKEFWVNYCVCLYYEVRSLRVER